MRALGRTLRRWHDQTVAWHRSRVSNGPTEAANNLIKRIKRIGFGFRRLAHHRLRVLLYAGRPNSNLINTIHPAQIRWPDILLAVYPLWGILPGVLQTVVSPRFTIWLNQLPRRVAIAVASDLDYLARHGRAAALPYARHRIQASAHFPDMSETRTEIDHDQHRWILRCLTTFANNDQALIVCLGGDKAIWSAAHPGRDWTRHGSLSPTRSRPESRRRRGGDDQEH